MAWVGFVTLSSSTGKWAVLLTFFGFMRIPLPSRTTDSRNGDQRQQAQGNAQRVPLKIIVLCLEAGHLHKQSAKKVFQILYPPPPKYWSTKKSTPAGLALLVLELLGMVLSWKIIEKHHTVPKVEWKREGLYQSQTNKAFCILANKWLSNPMAELTFSKTELLTANCQSAPLGWV